MSDEIHFMDEDEEIVERVSKKENWKVLIVDDEKEIHMVTTHVLKDFYFKERGIDFLSAYSAEEAKELLLVHNDTALIFLDVVMETDDAGLKLIEWIRGTLGNNFVRIVLRTGQPGLAPEKDVIMNYDIDDYRAKTELTAVRLFTTTVASLRSYNIMMDQEDNRKSLESVVKASWAINSSRSTDKFLEGITPQISSFMSLGENSFFSEIIIENGDLKLPALLGRGRFNNLNGDIAKNLSNHEKELINIAFS